MISFERVGEGPSIVLVHGITESRRAWDPLIGPLARSHDVLAVDLRGHGESEVVPPYDLITMATDVHEVVESLGVPDPLMVGHSLGGTVVSAYAAMFECRGVVNVDQSLRLGSFQAALKSIEPMLRGDEATFLNLMSMLFDSMRGRLGDKEWARLSALRHPVQEVVLGVWSAVLDLEVEELDAEVYSIASAIDVPYLALHGTDPGDGYEAWLNDLVDDLRVELWDGLGHYPHLVEPQRFVALVNEFEAGIAQ